MWEIYEHRSLSKALKKVPKEIQKRFEVWKRIIEFQGPEGLKLIKGFHDESLKGNWKGYRSSRLNLKWRIILDSAVEIYCERFQLRNLGLSIKSKKVFVKCILWK